MLENNKPQYRIYYVLYIQPRSNKNTEINQWNIIIVIPKHSPGIMMDSVGAENIKMSVKNWVENVRYSHRKTVDRCAMCKFKYSFALMKTIKYVVKPCLK